MGKNPLITSIHPSVAGTRGLSESRRLHHLDPATPLHHRLQRLQVM